MRIENEGHLCIFEETTDLFILNSLRNINICMKRQLQTFLILSLKVL